MSSQAKEELEKWYAKEDPWGYKTTEDDEKRKHKLLDYVHQGLSLVGGTHFDRALDIGCGEGFITKDLPAKTIHGMELSDAAAERLPSNVKRVAEPEGKYDLVVCTGMLYEHYDYKQFVKWIKNHAVGLVLICNIKEWEVGGLNFGKLWTLEEFPYREFTQRLRMFRCQ